jgi:PucR C-terminal helix-turn-helix domain/GGDEF-like domain
MQAPLELRKLRERARARGVDALASEPARAFTSRRFVPVAGAGPTKDVGVGDIAVLDRNVVGRRSLVRLADELALRGAAGLVVSEETIAPLPADLRRSIQERIPLLVVDSEWDRAKSWLLDVEPSASRMQPDAVLRSILRGHAQGGPLPGDVDLTRPIHAIVIVAYPEGPSQAVSLDKLAEISAAEAELADPRSFVLSLEGMVAVLSNQYGRGHDGESIGRAILHRATSSLLAPGLTIGLGRPYAGAPGMRRTYREAKWAASVGEMLWGGNRVVSFRDLGIYGLLEPFVTDPSSSDTQDVQKLIEYDRHNQTALLATVEAYFDAGRSGDAAATLFVHRNTIAYRLRAVRRVTGLDIVRDPDARLLLEVQIRLARLWGILPAAPAHVAVRRARRGGTS